MNGKKFDIDALIESIYNNPVLADFVDRHEKISCKWHIPISVLHWLSVQVSASLRLELSTL